MALSFDSKQNFAYSVVAVAPSPADTGTSLEVAPGDGAKFPAPPFNVVVWPASVQPTTSNAEVLRVTAVATDTFTIVREQEGSSARTIGANDQIALNITAKTLTDIEDAFQTASAAVVPVGTISMWMTDTPPTGYLLLQGQAVSRTTYSDLFALWGTTFGAGDGATTFTLPDFQQYIPIGKATAGTVSTLGAKTGSFDHSHGAGTLTVASHTHGPGTLTVASHTHGSGTLAVASHTHSVGTFAADSTNIDHSHSLSNHTHSYSAHTHTYSGTTGGPSLTGTYDAINNNATAANATHTHDISGTTDSGGGGTTGTPSDNFTSSSGGSHTHSISGTSASTAPSVNSGSTGATAPLVGSGVTAGTAPAVSSGSTATSNPPVIAVNFMVRALSSI